MSRHDSSPADRRQGDARKPGSRSKGHRGWRPAEEAAEAPKRRWSDADRADRAERQDRRGGQDRPARGADRDRQARGDRADRPARSFDRDDRPKRSFDRDDRGARPARSSDRSDRTARDDRPSRGHGDRPSTGARSFHGRDDRPARSFDRDDRPKRSFDRDERPARGDRPARSFDRDDRGARPARSFDRSDRPARFSDRDDRSGRDDRGGRPVRADRGGRQGRGGAQRGQQDRVPLVDRWDQPARPARDYREYRPERSTDRRFQDDRPVGSFDARRPREEREPRQATAARFDRDRGQREPVEDVVLARLQGSAIAAEAVEGTGFEDLGIGQNLARTLAELGAVQPFPIQAATIPQVLAGRDVLGRGRTGSGKTIAFGAPMVERLLRLHREANPEGGRGRRLGRPPRALILAPTRELAQQIDRTVQDLARSVGLFTISLVGGVPYHRQITGLERGVDIVIGTPGRIEDLVERGDLDLSEVVISVLDEADHMCDLGFLEPVQRILRLTKDGGQKLLFSATLDTAIATLIEEFLVDPSVHEVAGEDQESGTIEHHLLMVDPKRKREIIVELTSGASRTIVFTRTRAFAEMLAEELDAAGVATASLHGDLNQARRNRNLGLLTSGKVRVLVATDVAARGIHVDDVPLVIQADAPEEYKTYLHRSGRTGRAGADGTVVTLIGRTRRRKMEELLERAEIVPIVTDVAPGDAFIHELAAR